jgi:hypothetical protein
MNIPSNAAIGSSVAWARALPTACVAFTRAYRGSPGPPVPAARRDRLAGDAPRWFPFALAAAIVALDQLTKAWVVAEVPLGARVASWAGWST